MNIPKFDHLPERYRLVQYPLNMDAAMQIWPHLFQTAYGRHWQPIHEEQLSALMVYASGNLGKIPSDRGVYIYGKVGTGKSMIIETLRHFTLQYWTKNWWRAYDCNTIALVKNEEAFAQYINFDRPAYFDDLGNEPLCVKLYGSELYPMLEIITARYNLWQRKGIPTHFTSNYDLAWCEEHYGTRIASRLSEMCTVIEIKGSNLRITKT